MINIEKEDIVNMMWEQIIQHGLDRDIRNNLLDPLEDQDDIQYEIACQLYDEIGKHYFKLGFFFTDVLQTPLTSW